MQLCGERPRRRQAGVGHDVANKSGFGQGLIRGGLLFFISHLSPKAFMLQLLLSHCFVISSLICSPLFISLHKILVLIISGSNNAPYLLQTMPAHPRGRQGLAGSGRCCHHHHHRRREWAADPVLRRPRSGPHLPAQRELRAHRVLPLRLRVPERRARVAPYLSFTTWRRRGSDDGHLSEEESVVGGHYDLRTVDFNGTHDSYYYWESFTGTAAAGAITPGVRASGIRRLSSSPSRRARRRWISSSKRGRPPTTTPPQLTTTTKGGRVVLIG